ncbi:MAG: hypothetical protein GY832_13115, partial [Chloroflexi bacterium]|nr:hypothetical protein [Chloroflexota bacterium]
QFRQQVAAYKEVRAAHIETPSDDLRKRVRAARREALQITRSYKVCPDCGASLSKKIHDSRRQMHCQDDVFAWDVEEAKLVTHSCRAALFQFGGQHRRWPLADYVSKKMQRTQGVRGFFQSLIADECFPGNTLVSTPSGSVPIKDINIGDKVLSYKDGKIVARRVIRTIIKPRFGRL